MIEKLAASSSKFPLFHLSFLVTLFFLGTLISSPVSAQLKPTVEAGHTVALSQPLTLRWKFDSDQTLNLTPAFDNESLYVPLAGGTLVSLKAGNGQLRWRSEIGGELSASPVADRERVYVASEIGSREDDSAGRRAATGTLRAVGREGGVTQWMRTLAKPLRGSLTLQDGTIFAGGGDGKFYAFDSSTGNAKWGFAYSASFNGQPLVAGSRVYAGSEDGSLLAFDENSGKLLWRFRTKGPVRGPAVVVDNTVFVGSGDGYVYAIGVGDGKLRWRKRTGAGIEAVARAGDGLLVASLDNFVYLYSLRGRRIWKRQLPGRISSQPFTTTDGALFTPLSSAAAVVLGLEDGRPVNSLPTEDELTSSASPIGVGDAVFLTTQHGVLAFSHPREASSKDH